MRRRDLHPDIHASPPSDNEVYETNHGEITFYRQDFRQEAAEIVLSYVSGEGEARIPLFPHPQGSSEDASYETSETISGLWWKHIDADLEATGTNPLENVMALFEEEGNVVIEDLKDELTIYIPTLLEAHGIPIDYNVDWVRAEYSPHVSDSEIEEGLTEVGGVEASEAVTNLDRAPQDLPATTTLRGRDSQFPVEEAIDGEPIDEGEVPDYLLQTESEPWED